MYAQDVDEYCAHDIRQAMSQTIDYLFKKQL